jgi:hypothetical protein
MWAPHIMPHAATNDLPLAVGALLAGCIAYPPAEEVAACAASRLGTERGTFTVTDLTSSSLLSARQSAITYRKNGSPDRATVIFNRRSGPTAVQQEVSYGNHAEIKRAVEAIRVCANGWSGRDHAP